MYAADDYLPVLGRDLEHLEASRSTVIGLRPDLSVGFLNSAFFQFARDNGGGDGSWLDPERPVVESFLPPLREFYGALYRRAIDRRKPEHHDYQCPSPELFRRFRLRAMPRPGGLVLVHQLIEQHPHDEEPHDPDRSIYECGDGVITQCCHCRSTRRCSDPDTWDFVPAWVVDEPENLSHGFCRLCFRYYYPELARRYDETHPPPPPCSPGPPS